MSGPEDSTTMMVKCKWCPARNEKLVHEHSVKCEKCGKVTAYIIPTRRKR